VGVVIRQFFDDDGYVNLVCEGTSFTPAGQLGNEFSCGVFTPMGR